MSKADQELPSGTRVIVISGPGGVGKGTLVKELLARDEQLWLSRSWTTRARRPGEDPDAYHFVDTERFRAHIDDDGFLEWAPFLDYLQGSPRPAPPPGKDVLFEIDVQGARRIAELYPDALLIFVDAPNRQIQEDRMRGRGDSEDRIVQRLRKAQEELERASELDFEYVINDVLEEAVDHLERLIGAHRAL